MATTYPLSDVTAARADELAALITNEALTQAQPLRIIGALTATDCVVDFPRLDRGFGHLHTRPVIARTGPEVLTVSFEVVGIDAQGSKADVTGLPRVGVRCHFTCNTGARHVITEPTVTPLSGARIRSHWRGFVENVWQAAHEERARQVARSYDTLLTITDEEREADRAARATYTRRARRAASALQNFREKVATVMQQAAEECWHDCCEDAMGALESAATDLQEVHRNIVSRLQETADAAGGDGIDAERVQQARSLASRLDGMQREEITAPGLTLADLWDEDDIDGWITDRDLLSEDEPAFEDLPE